MDKTKYIKANSVAFSGHRTIAENCKDEIRKKLRGKIRLLYAMGFTNFFCGMALGFDMLAAEEVISLKAELPKLKLIAVYPLKDKARGGVQESKTDIRASLPKLTIASCYVGIISKGVCSDAMTICCRIQVV